jgi:hypothetical protein
VTKTMAKKQRVAEAAATIPGHRGKAGSGLMWPLRRPGEVVAGPARAG